MYDYILDAMIELDDGEVPCQIGVAITDIAEGSGFRNDVSDADYYGYVDYKYDILDMDGQIMKDLTVRSDPIFDRYVQELLTEKLGNH